MIGSIRARRAGIRCLGLAILVPLLVGGCAGPKIAADLLATVPVSAQPLVGNSVAVSVTINPRINNHEKIDQTVKESLELALANARLFGPDSSRPYRIEADVMEASQAAMSFGSFEGKLRIRYAVLDDGGAKVLDETIYTVAGSDKMYFSGAKRHRRARAVNISKNVLQFVGMLHGRLQAPP